MNIEIDLGFIGLIDAEVLASIEKVRGKLEVELKSVTVVLPLKFNGKNSLTIDVLPMMESYAKSHIEQEFLERCNITPEIE